MTFAEYNTDDNFKKPSNAMELVRLGKAENMTREGILNALSPLWKEDKKGNVKKALDYYFKDSETVTEEEPKEKQKTETPTAEPFKEEETAPTESQKFYSDATSIQDDAQNKEVEKNRKDMIDRWTNRLVNAQKMGEMQRSVDDHMVEQLPTSVWNRYKNGDFGEVGSKDAKQRFAYFVINGLGSALKAASNSFMSMAGRSPVFGDITSDYEKYQQTNLQQGLENRWNKYKTETANAMELARQGGMDEEGLENSIATISSNNRMQTAFNMMNEKQKAFTFQVLAEIGNNLGNMNDNKFVNTLFGMAAMGDSLDPKETAAMLVYRFGKDPSKVKTFINGLGFDVGDIKEIDGQVKAAGIGGTKNSAAVMKDGTVINPGLTMNDKEYEELAAQANKLSEQYYNGELTEEAFRKEYKKLEDVMKKHPIKGLSKNILSANDVIKKNNQSRLNELDSSLVELNFNVSSGAISPSDYKDQFDNLVENAKKWGATEKELKALEKKRLSTEKILKAVEKSNKKKK